MIGVGELVILAVIVGLGLKFIVGRRGVGHAPGCLGWVVGLLGLAFVVSLLLPAIQAARHQRFLPATVDGNGESNLAIRTLIEQMEPMLAVELSPDACRGLNISSAEVTATLVTLVDIVREEQRSEPDRGAMIDLAPLWQTPVRPDQVPRLELRDIGHLRYTKPPALVPQIRFLLVSAEAGERGRVAAARAKAFLGKIGHELAMVNASRGGESGRGFEIIPQSDVILIHFNPMSSPAPEAQIVVNDAATAVASEAGTLAMRVAAAVKSTIAGKLEPAAEAADASAVARKIAAQAVSALLDVVLSDRSEVADTPAPAAAPPAPPIPVVPTVAPAPPGGALPVAVAQPVATTASSASEADAPTRPAWVTSPPPLRIDEKGVFQITGTTGAVYSTPQDSREAAGEVVRALTSQYVSLLLGDAAAKRVRPQDIPRHLINTTLWPQRVESPVSGLPLYETHVLLEFDDTARRAIERQWRHARTNERLLYIGTSAGLVLGLIGTLFGYLKLDTATRGYYSGRLKLAAGTFLSILVTMAVLALTRLGI